MLTRDVVLIILLLLAWIAWWLWAVNWQKTWAFLALGAWAPLVLLIIAAAMSWSQLAPSHLFLFGFLVVPNFWWQLLLSVLLVGLALFCGWLQGYFGWMPAEISVEPVPVAAHGHEHGHH